MDAVTLLRHRVAEWMDDPAIPAAEHAHALQGLARLNAISRAHRLIWPPLHALARRVGRPLQVLDVASGGGDLPRRLDALARRAGVELHWILSDRSRQAVEPSIERSRASGMTCEAAVIDAVNILQATLMAMRDAVLELSPPPEYLLIDGLNRIDSSIPQETIVRGDSRSISVAAASIVAKVSRDRLMEMYHRQFPQYNFAGNKGYGTREHREAIVRFGRSKIHRRSFRVAGIDDPQPTAPLLDP